MSEPMTDAGLCEFWRERAQKAEAECDALRDERDKAEHETGKAYIERDTLRAALNAMLEYTADLDPLQGFEIRDHEAVKQARAALKEAK